MFDVRCAALSVCGEPNPGADAAQVRRGLQAIEGIAQEGFTLAIRTRRRR